MSKRSNASKLGFSQPAVPRKTLKTVRLTLLGVGAMNSPRYQPAGLLVQHGKTRLMIDGGVATANHKLTAWLVTDEKGELIREIRKSSRQMGLEPKVAGYWSDELSITPHSVIHTSHDTYGYTIEAKGKKIVWAPEFLKFPRWARGADLMFAEAAAWNRPILFRGHVGGHAAVEQVARSAQKYGVRDWSMRTSAGQLLGPSILESMRCSANLAVRAIPML
jgi:hypothetical protein